MKQQQSFEKIADFIQKNTSADDFTLRIFNKDHHYARFARNAITQHSSGKRFGVRLTVSFDAKQGSCATNQTDEDSLRKLISDAEQIAKLNKTDPEHLPSVSQQELPEVDNYDEDTATFSSEEMVKLVKQSVQNAESKKAVIAGMTEKEVFETYLATGNGFRGNESGTIFSHSMTMKKDAVETKVSKSVKNIQDFSIQSEIDMLNKQFDALKTPQPFEKGKYNVILRPAAFLDLIHILFWVFKRRDADEGLTPYTNQIGKPFFGDRFSVYSTLTHPKLYAPRFNHQGIATKDIKWIDKGIIKAMPTSRFYAKQVGIDSVQPYNFVIAGEDYKEEQMMQMVPNGLIINRLWYLRIVDMKRGEFTGLTRDGVMYFENGEIKHSVNNFRWNEVFYETTKRILALGKNEVQEYYVDIPPVLIKDFNFVDTTTF